VVVVVVGITSVVVVVRVEFSPHHPILSPRVHTTSVLEQAGRVKQVQPQIQEQTG
jgi:hypothetical protein